jgi:hypothetical protein
VRISDFFQAAKDLEDQIEGLQLRVKNSMEEAGDLVCAPDDETTASGVPPIGAVHLILRGFNSKIREVMSAQDRIPGW